MMKDMLMHGYDENGQGTIIPRYEPLENIKPYEASALLYRSATREEVLDFARYLEVAEEHRLAFHKNPQRDKVSWGNFLPYAIALGLKTDWMKQFFYGYVPIKHPTPE